MRFKLALLGEIRFNPLVSLLSICLIILFVAWCLILKGDAPLFHWKSLILSNFSWFYIRAQNIWAIFIITLYFSKYSKLKLGKPDDGPEFNTATWFMMLFACGIGVGLFFYGVGEAIHQNRYTTDHLCTATTLLFKRPSFYPLIGDRIFGWIGDVIDVVSVLNTLFVVCTSLGLGTIGQLDLVLLGIVDF